MQSIYVNWSDADIRQRWNFVGANIVFQSEVLRLEKCPHCNQHLGYCNECNCFPEDRRNVNFPMMNYAYPLYSEPDEKTIYRVCNETSCTVVHNMDDDSYYLALAGGGMDLSQDIALAYIIADGCIEWSMLEDVYISGPISVSEDNYRIILKELKRQLSISINNRKAKLKEVKEQLIQFPK